MNLEQLRDFTESLRAQIRRVVIGQDTAIDLLLIALLTKGHVLIESVPGTAKTLLARTFAAALALDFKRIQFTPDLMPGDVIGTNLFNFQTNRFTLIKGPVFTDVLLADEINRTPPKTQAAMLEAMQERAVTIDSETYPLSPSFMVIATQNPIEQQGTYPLPEAQLDRFLFLIRLDYLSREDECIMVRLHGSRTMMPSLSDFGIEICGDSERLAAARALVTDIHLTDELIDYIVQIVRATRENSALLCGASPRAANMLAVAARAAAALQGRDFVTPDDIKNLARPALRHRLLLAPGAEIEGISPETVLTQILDRLRAPR